jgi:hypothetical protein
MLSSFNCSRTRLGFETNIRPHPAHSRLYTRPTKCNTVEDVVSVRYDASSLVLDVWNEKRALTSKGLEVRRKRSPQRHNHESLNTYIKVNSESQNQNINLPVQITQTSSRMIITSTSHDFRQNKSYSSYWGTRWRSGWGTALQTGRSRVRFPGVSLDFFIDVILPATQPLTKMSTRNISWG